MGKKLVRITINIWGVGLQIKEFPIVKENEHVVFIVRERERRNPETGYKETVRVAGPFNRKDIGVIFLCKPGTGKGTKKMYLISEADDPLADAGVQSGIQDMLQEIREELSAAKMFLEILEHNINMGDEKEQGG